MEKIKECQEIKGDSFFYNPANQIVLDKLFPLVECKLRDIVASSWA